MRAAYTTLLLILSAGLSSYAFAEPPQVQNGYFVDKDGAALYTYDKDSDGKSVCKDQCAKNWPPALADPTDTASGDWTIIESHDGKPMWAYKGQALYRFVKDKNPGDTNGDGAGGVWHLAKP